MMIDSGADVNVISEQDWLKLQNEFENGEAMIYDIDFEPKTVVKSYAAKHSLELICSFKSWVETVKKPKPNAFASFLVVKGSCRSLLGRSTAKRMQLLRVGLEVNALNEDNPEAVEEFPSIPNKVIDFDIDESVPAVRHQYVSIPAHYRKPANERLRSMARQGIIEKVTTAPRWLSGLSAVPKGKNNFRLVVNMRGPNRAIRRQFHRMPRVEEIKIKLNGSKWFTKLDLTSAFHHLKLSDRSRELTTFLTPDGMYRFTRLVFGVNCAPEIFQRTMEEVLQGIDGVIIYIDDILIHAADQVQLRERTRKVLEALAENKLTLNNEKCEFEKESLVFLGHKLSAKGLDIDEEKIKDIRGFRQPQTASELKSFIGLATYVSAFIPHFADLTKPLRDVSNKNFKWEDEQELAFQKTKEAIITCTTTQGFFDMEDETFLYTDASPSALGAVLVQRNSAGAQRIISFASKTLSKTERRYAQTQREALAVVWATEHFYYYLLGQKFTICTDAQGISYIFDRKGEAPRRIMRRAEGWAMRLDAFDYKISFIPGKENIADPPSRLCTGPDEEYIEGEAPCEIAEIVADQPEEISFGDDYLPPLEIAYHTAKDEELRAVMKAMETGDWSKDLGQFKTIEDELHEANGILMRMGLAVVPRDLRFKALTLAHKGHPGSTKMKSIIRARAWWPKLDSMVDDWVKSCKTCQLGGRREPPTPMRRAQLPESPWDLVAVDYCGPYASLGGISVLVLTDYYSRFMVAGPVRSTDFNSAKARLSGIFDIFGFPAQIKSDNGPPFNSNEWLTFCSDRGIEAKFIWPLNPQQNGMVERAMQTVGKAIAAAAVEGRKFNESLAETISAYNSGAHRVTNLIPNEVMFGRRLRGSLPLVQPALVTIDHDKMREKDWAEKLRAKEREDRKRGARPSDFAVNDKVVLRRAIKRKGQTTYDPTELVVVENRNGDLTMRAPDGHTIRRNQTWAKKIVERAVLPPHIDQSGTATTQQDAPSNAASNGSDTVENAVGLRPRRNAGVPSRYLDYLIELSQM